MMDKMKGWIKTGSVALGIIVILVTFIAAVEWRVHRHQDELTLSLSVSEPLQPLLEYIQALRDVPQQEGFPNEIEWPSLEDING